MFRIFGQVMDDMGEALQNVLVTHGRRVREHNRPTLVVVCIAAKLRVRTLRVRLRMVVSSPVASSINQLRKSF